MTAIKMSTIALIEMSTITLEKSAFVIKAKSGVNMVVVKVQTKILISPHFDPVKPPLLYELYEQVCLVCRLNQLIRLKSIKSEFPSIYDIIPVVK